MLVPTEPLSQGRVNRLNTQCQKQCRKAINSIDMILKRDSAVGYDVIKKGQPGFSHWFFPATVVVVVAVVFLA